MIPIILGLAGAAYAAYVAKRKKKQQRPTLPIQQAKAVHTQLMTKEFRPTVLKKAAKKFGAEGYPTLERELRSKANQVEKQMEAIPDLVQRARAGDQNAMGMITSVRENAQHGHVRAQVTEALIKEYCAKNPVPAEAN